MYEHFTDRARKVMQLANQEAQRVNHEYIGTEHLLLGIVREESGSAAIILKNLDIDLRKIRMEIEKIVVCGPDAERHRAEIEKYAEAGFDHVYVHQIGPAQEEFIEFYASEIIPKIAA